jgi:hypothetical protein
MLQASVTDQGSPSILCPASSGCGEVRRHRSTLLPRWPARQPGADVSEWLRCRVCGRAGRFVDPFPRLPRRR